MLDAAEFSGLSFVRKHSPAARRPAEARFHRLLSARKAKPSDGALDRRAYGSDSRTVEFLGVLAGPWRRKAGFRVHIGRRQGHPAFQLRIGITDDLPRMRIGGPPALDPELVGPCPKSDVDLGRPLFGGAHRHYGFCCHPSVRSTCVASELRPLHSSLSGAAEAACTLYLSRRPAYATSRPAELREPPRPCVRFSGLWAGTHRPFDGCCRCPTDEVEHENRQRTVRYL